MAKRKRSTALFEVISNSKQYRPGRPATARSGSWLAHATSFFTRPKFKPIVPAPRLLIGRKAQSAQEMEYEEAPQATAAQEAAFAEPIQNDLPEESPTYQPPPPPTQALAIVAPAPVAVAAPAVPRAPRNWPSLKKWKFEPKLSYGTGMAAAAALLLVVGIAVVATRKWNHAATPLLAQVTTDDLRKGTAHPEVLDPPRRGVIGVPHAADTKAVPSARVLPVTETHASQTPPATPAADSKRYTEYNYVVIQSYPDSELPMADKAAAFLNSRGVTCTVEHNVKGFLKVSVVSLEGFAKISSPECKTFIEHVKSLSTEFTSGSKRFKGFDPIAKSWKAQG